MPIDTNQLEIKKIPKLRFPGFSSEWEEKKLGKVLQIIDGDRGSNYPNGDDFCEEGYCLFLNAKNVTRGGFSFDEKSFITKDKDDQLRKGKLRREDIVLTTRGSVGHIAYYNDNIPFDNIRVNSGMVLLRGGREVVKPDFTYRFLDSKKIQNVIKRISFGSAQPQLTVKEISNLNILFPPLLEQQKIAAFLGVADEWIGNLREQKENFESYKKGITQKIFSQEIRFKDDNGKEFPKWEEKKLGEVGKAYNGLTGKAGEDFGQGEDFITYKQIFDSSEIDIQKFSLVNVSSGERQNKAQFGDIFFTTSSETPGEVGFSSVLLDKNIAPYLNSFSFGLRLNSLKEYDPYFAKFFFRSFVFRKEVVKLAQGSTRYNISKVEFMKMKFLFPSVLEQQKIAEFLTSIDKIIESKQQQITQAEHWKKGLMQGLFV